ncbi:conserved exported hypothetical protein [Tenacibaculum sediminilitoris]|uniref:DUF6503 family protein n=1 Tax=Tenacibaculum sediminilitoris TaxID=1820334 RepID=UPI0038967F72
MRYLYILLLLLIVSCKPKFTAQEIIDKSIESSKLSYVGNTKISFNFRENYYKATRNNGAFELVRIIKNDSIKIKDILSNDSFKRFVNDSLVKLTEKDKNRYSNSVNSVHYFSVLPFGLNDKAVQKKLLEPVTIKGKEYYKVRVTFTEEGGGEDFEDVFIYWFAKDDFQLDYLAYKYHTNGGGVRFRDAKEEKIVKGIRFVDYNNYKPLDKEIDFYTIDKLYEEGKLKKISEIVLEDIQVDTF